MSELKEVKLPSGARLRMGLASFVNGRNLYQSILKEIEGLKFDVEAEMDVNFFKDILIKVMSSKEVEEKLFICMEKSLYNNEKITEETFEPEDARQDYIDCLSKIAWFNILPFGKALFAKYETIFGKVIEGLKSK